MRNLAIISARSGSKGLPDKNIKMLLGKPLIAYTIEAAKNSHCFDTIMVSTDSEKYADISKEYGAEVPFLRSEEMSGDNVGSWDVVREVLTNYKMMGEEFDTICLLQPTSPLRTAEDIVAAYNIYSKKSAKAITAVTETEHSPLWCMTLPNDYSLEEFRKMINKEAPRQALPQYYRINGAIYIRTVENGNVGLLGEEEYAYVMPRERSVDIDTQIDFEYAEFLLTRKINETTGDRYFINEMEW